MDPAVMRRHLERVQAERDERARRHEEELRASLPRLAAVLRALGSLLMVAPGAVDLVHLEEAAPELRERIEREGCAL